jgi:Bifunctional DNA primase/polymerase, N-terminal
MTSSDQPRGFSLPDSFLEIASVDQAVTEYTAAGLRPILIHSAVVGDETRNCTCGQKHEVTESGSSSAAKHPVAKNWQTQKLSRDELIDARSRLKFVPNIGMVLGEQAHGAYWIAVDVDDFDRFAELEKELGPLPETIRCDSGRGYRLFYELPPEIDTSQLRNVTGLSTGDKKVAGVDVKAKGGQVVVAPSLHANGKRYAWTRAGLIAKLPMTWAIELLDAPKAPKWIHEKYTPSTLNADARAKNRAEKYFEAAVTGRAASLAACGKGIRNNTLHKSAVYLFAMCADSYLGGSTWSFVHRELFSAARACGLDERETRTTLASAEKWVVETGAVRTPIALSNPDRRPRPAPSQSDDSFSVPDPDTSASPSPPADAQHVEHKDPRPIITVTTELHETVSKSIDALCAEADLYQREKRLVTVVRVSREQIEASQISTDGGETYHQLIEGTPQICELTRPVIKGFLSKVAVFQKWLKKEQCYTHVLPPEDVVAHIHDQESWGKIRPIVGVIETPTVRPDGTIIQSKKNESVYDPVTRYIYAPSESFRIVRDEDCTQKNAEYYLKYLSGIFEDFPYVNPAHRSVPIAAILTLIARPAILGSVPAFLFDASTRGSGKTLQTDAIATLATGRGAPRMNYTSNEEELEKILAGYALKGAPFICLDNVPAGRAFGGGPLDRVLTARDTVDLRILGRSEVPTLKWRAVVMATGNNMTLYGDTARRVLKARLEPNEQNPERRTKFKHNDLLLWVRTNRARLVSGALLMLRAYWRAGCPNMGCARWGSFEEWSKLIPNAIVFAGGADPMEARPESDEEVDPESQAMFAVIDQLPLLIEKVRTFESVNGTTSYRDSIAARTIIDCLYSIKPEWSEFEPLKDAVETLCKVRNGRTPDAVSLGSKLRSIRSRVIGGRRLVCDPNGNHTMMWRVEKVQ